MRFSASLLLLAAVVSSFGRTGGPDTFGHMFVNSDEAGLDYEWVGSADALVITELGGEDDYYIGIDCPFPIMFFGHEYELIYATTNGLLTFGTAGRGVGNNTDLPDPDAPNRMIGVYWDDLMFGPVTTLLVKTGGSTGSRYFSITWNGVFSYTDWSYTDPMTFQTVFTETDGETEIRLQYQDPEGRFNPFGAGATVGIENAVGTDALVYSFNTAALAEELAIVFRTGYYARDIGVISLDIVDTVLAGDAVEPAVRLVNTGSVSVSAFPLYIIVTDIDGDTLHVSTETIPGLDAGEIADFTLSSMDIEPGWAGEAIIRARAAATGDENPDNDTLSMHSFILGMDAAIVEIPGYPVYPLGMDIPLSAVVRNRTLETLNVPVFISLQGAAGDTILTRTESITIGPMDMDTLFFADWPASESLYTLTAIAQCPGDPIAGNDTLQRVFLAYEHFGTAGPDSGGYFYIDSYHDPAVLLPPPTLEGGYDIGLIGDDATTSVSFPFNFEFYGDEYESGYVSANGYLTFAPSIYPFFTNDPIPHPDLPNGLICPFWSDLYIDWDSQVLTKNWPTTEFHVIWWNVGFLSSYSSGERITFELILYDSGDIAFNYMDMETPTDSINTLGGSGTVGIEDYDGLVGLEYCYNGTPPGNRLWNNFTILFTMSEPMPDTLPPVVNISRLADTMMLDGDTLHLAIGITDYPSGVLSDTLYIEEPFVRSVTRDSTAVDGFGHYSIAGLSHGDDVNLIVAATDRVLNRGETYLLIHVISDAPIDTDPPEIELLTADSTFLHPGTRNIYFAALIRDESEIVSDLLHYTILGTELTQHADSTWSDTLFHYTITPFWSDDIVNVSVEAEDMSGNVGYSDTADVLVWQKHILEKAGYYIVDNHLLPPDGGLPGYPDSLIEMMPEYNWIEIDTVLGGDGIPLRPDAPEWLSSWLNLPGDMFVTYSGRDRTGFRIGAGGYVTFESAAIPEMEIAIMPFLAELVPGPTSMIYYLAQPDSHRVIVQWSDFLCDTPTTGGFTFQLVMAADTVHFDAKAQYRIMPPEYYHYHIFDREPLIGLRNPFTDVPLFQRTNQTPLHSRLPQIGTAIRFVNFEDSSAVAEELLPDRLTLTAFPNPFNAGCQITIPEGFTAAIYDIHGRQVHALPDGTSIWNAEGMPTGVYLVRAQRVDTVVEKRVVLVR